jgi:hypothetical protein
MAGLLLLTGCAAQESSLQNGQQPGALQGGSQTQQTAQIPTDPREYGDYLVKGPFKQCAKETDGGKAYLCFDSYFEGLVNAEGPERAFKDIKPLYDAVPLVRTYCHPLAHVIGRAAVTKYPKLSDAYLHGDDFCWSGYYHGVMETYVDKIGRDKLPAHMPTICDEIPGKESYSFSYYNCVHGLGHGVMALTQDELFDSLKLCDNLLTDWDRKSCYSGVYMENVIVDGLNHTTKYLKPEEPVYPCNAVETKYKEPCYLMQTSYMLKVNNYDFKNTFDICKTVDADFVDTCYRSLGRDASGSSVSDIENTRAKCFLGEDYRQKSQCIVGAVKDFISYYHDDAKARQLCESLGDKEMTSLCLTTATDYYKSF